mmetsp:Transcript_3505/g.9493  ORF Transcript_3505/g.9493 Transcript_3505/m.9493 type:complete len:209 (+) Transcript_3505:227-853(+)
MPRSARGSQRRGWPRFLGHRPGQLFLSKRRAQAAHQAVGGDRPDVSERSKSRTSLESMAQGALPVPLPSTACSCGSGAGVGRHSGCAEAASPEAPSSGSGEFCWPRDSRHARLASCSSLAWSSSRSFMASSLDSQARLPEVSTPSCSSRERARFVVCSCLVTEACSCCSKAHARCSSLCGRLAPPAVAVQPVTQPVAQPVSFGTELSP